MLQKLCNLHELQVSICEIVYTLYSKCINCDILDAKAPSHQSELSFRKKFFLCP